MSSYSVAVYFGFGIWQPSYANIKRFLKITVNIRSKTNNNTINIDIGDICTQVLTLDRFGANQPTNVYK